MYSIDATPATLVDCETGEPTSRAVEAKAIEIAPMPRTVFRGGPPLAVALPVRSRLLHRVPGAHRDPGRGCPGGARPQSVGERLLARRLLHVVGVDTAQRSAHFVLAVLVREGLVHSVRRLAESPDHLVLVAQQANRVGDPGGILRLGLSSSSRA